MQRGRPSKKEYILQASRNVFSTYGYQGTTIDLILQAAEVSKPTIYNNFSSKLALWSALVDAINAELKAMYEQRCAHHTDPSDWPHLITHLYQDSVSKPEYVTVYRVALGENYKMDNEITQKLAHHLQQVMSAFKIWAQQHTLPFTKNQYKLLAGLCFHEVITPALMDTAATDSQDVSALLLATIDIKLNSALT